MNTTDRAMETRYFFMVMGNLAKAKAAGDAVGIADSIADLEMIAMHFDADFLAQRAAREVEQATALLAELQASRIGYAGAVAAVDAVAPANLN